MCPSDVLDAISKKYRNQQELMVFIKSICGGFTRLATHLCIILKVR